MCVCFKQTQLFEKQMKTVLQRETDPEVTGWGVTGVTGVAVSALLAGTSVIWQYTPRPGPDATVQAGLGAFAVILLRL